MIELRDAHPLLNTWSDDGAYHLDVRGLLEQGGEPYVYIMDCLNQMDSGDRLVVHALFEPKPLISQVQRMGLEVRSERIAAEHWALHVLAP